MNRNLFSETQRFTQPWIWLLILVIAALSWWAFYVQVMEGRPFGDNPAPDAMVWVVFIVTGLLLPAFLLLLRLVTEVTPEQVCVAFWPIHSRRIDPKEIRSVQAREYRPLAEYGGWGVRRSPTRGRAYNVSGKRGAQLELTDGRKVLIGSQRADELARAINQAMSQ